MREVNFTELLNKLKYLTTSRKSGLDVSGLYADCQKDIISMASKTNDLATIEKVGYRLVTDPRDIDRTNPNYVAGVAEFYNQTCMTMINQQNMGVSNLNQYDEDHVRGKVA